MVIATLDTYHFNFICLGVNETHAREKLREAWCQHQADHAPVHIDFDEMKGDINYVEIEPGQVFRDGALLDITYGAAMRAQTEVEEALHERVQHARERGFDYESEEPVGLLSGDDSFD